MNRKFGKSYWFDLPVPDLTDAMSFYETLLDWKFVKLQNQQHDDYLMIQSDDELIGGLRATKENKDKNSSHGPILYFTVDELKPKIKRAKELGATVMGNRVDLGNDRGCYQWFRDRANNLVGLWAPK